MRLMQLALTGRRALEAMNAVGKDLEETVEDAVPLLGINLLGELHGSLHVGEEHRHDCSQRGLERRRGLCRARGVKPLQPRGG